MKSPLTVVEVMLAFAFPLVLQLLPQSHLNRRKFMHESVSLEQGCVVEPNLTQPSSCFIAKSLLPGTLWTPLASGFICC